MTAHNKPGDPPDPRRRRQVAPSVVLRTLRTLAEVRPMFSTNYVRSLLDDLGVHDGQQQDALRRIERLGWVEPGGYMKATPSPPSKDGQIRLYRSLILICHVCRVSLSPGAIWRGSSTHPGCDTDTNEVPACYVCGELLSRKRIRRHHQTHVRCRKGR